MTEILDDDDDLLGLDEIEQHPDASLNNEQIIAAFMASTYEERMLFMNDLIQAMRADGDEQFRIDLSGMGLWLNADIMEGMTALNEFFGMED